MEPISETNVPLAAEDRFLIVSIREAMALCPRADDAAALGEAIRAAKPLLGNLIPVFDLRGLPQIYNDVDAFIDQVACWNEESHILLSPDTAKDVDFNYYAKRRGFNILSVEGRAYKTKLFDLNCLNSDVERLDNPIDALRRSIEAKFTNYDNVDENLAIDYDPPSLEMLKHALTLDELLRLVRGSFPKKIWSGFDAGEFAQSIHTFFPRLQESLSHKDDGERVHETEFYLGSAILHSFLRQLNSNSLLVEFVMTTDGQAVTCSPYHGSAIHTIERPNTFDVLLGRPAVLAAKTQILFSQEIEAFQRLLNESTTRERHLQKFLEDHPNFLSGLNYSNVYPQLVLEREDGSQLKPDFILEPYDDEWCDILDIKLPSQSLIVGTKDRATLAAGIHEVVAQLREYAAFFEQDKHRTFVREKYGLQIYKPRLIAVVGRDIRQMTDPQIRRAMTAYSDVRIMTFDQLVRHAQTRMLL
jgi:hypothetical protein